MSDDFYSENVTIINKYQTINLDNIDFTNSKLVLNTYINFIIYLYRPRSKEACRKTGIDPKQLYYIDFLSYKYSNPGFSKLTIEVQRSRWEHFNKLREQNIQLVQAERKRLIQENWVDNSVIKLIINF